MTRIRVPTETELADALAGLDRLLTAKRWERAAIVYAFTTNETGRPEAGTSTGFPCPMEKFATLGFAGLSSDRTVRRYRNAWQDAIDSGKAVPTQPGQDVDLPDLPWPPDTNHHRYDQPDADQLQAEAAAAGVGVTRVLDIAENTDALQAAILGSERVASAAYDALQRALHREEQQPGPPPPQPQPSPAPTRGGAARHYPTPPAPAPRPHNRAQERRIRAQQTHQYEETMAVAAIASARFQLRLGLRRLRKVPVTDTLRADVEPMADELHRLVSGLLEFLHTAKDFDAELAALLDAPEGR